MPTAVGINVQLPPHHLMALDTTMSRERGPRTHERDRTTTHELAQTNGCFERTHRNPTALLININVWFLIGHVYERMKDYAAAKDAYERMLKDSPNHAKVLQQLEWLYLMTGAPFMNEDTVI
ncbi:hypothetical protein FRC11_001344, partial [Ceratobasidium sp. 423]